MITVPVRRVLVGVAGVGILIAALMVGPHVATWAPDNTATFWVLFATAVAATWYGWLTHRLLRQGQTPVLVCAYTDDATVIRNFGAGAALNAVLTDDAGQSIGRVGDLAPAESQTLTKRTEWTINESRFVFYQDIYGRWYATKALGQSLGRAQNLPISNRFIGRVFDPPPAVRRGAHVRSAFEHFVQLNRSWDPRNWFRRFAYTYRRWRGERRLTAAMRTAVQSGRLVEPFTPAEAASAADIEGIVIDRFLRGHVAENPEGNRVYFVGEQDGRFRLKR